MSAYTMPISAFIYANQGKNRIEIAHHLHNDDNYSNTRDWAAGGHCSVMIATPYNNILTKSRTKIDGHSGSFWCYTQIIVTLNPRLPCILNFNFSRSRKKNTGEKIWGTFLFLSGERATIPLCVQCSK